MPAVLSAVTLFCVQRSALVGWLVTQQLASLVVEIPAYQQNIHQKIRDVRGFSEGGLLDQLQDAVRPASPSSSALPRSRMTRSG